MNLKTNSKTVWLAALAAVLALGSAAVLRAQTSIILSNPGFGDNFTVGISTGYDDPANDVPGWSNSGSTYTDSGLTDATFFQNNTPPAAYLKSGDSGAIQVTGYHMLAGDDIRLSWDAVNVSGETSQSVYLFSVTDAFLNFTVLNISTAAITGTQTGYTLNYTATVTDAGNLIGIGFNAGPTTGGYVAYDNFALQVTSIPEPATLALLALGALGFYLRRR